MVLLESSLGWVDKRQVFGTAGSLAQALSSDVTHGVAIGWVSRVASKTSGGTEPIRGKRLFGIAAA